MEFQGFSAWLHQWWPAIVSGAAVVYGLTLMRKVDEANERLRVIAANLLWIRDRLEGRNPDV